MRARTSSRLPSAQRAIRIATGLAILGVVFVAFVMGGVVWQIASRSETAVERLVAQTQLIIATLGLFATVILTGTTLYYAALTRRMANAAVASVEHHQLETTRAQADLVSAWASATAPPDDGPFGREQLTIQGPHVFALVAVRNASPVPVYNCTVLVRPHWGDFSPTSHAEVGGGHYWAVLPPGETTEWVQAFPIGELLTIPPVDIVFTDAAGLHWLRRGNGKLEYLDENPGGVC